MERVAEPAAARSNVRSSPLRSRLLTAGALLVAVGGYLAIRDWRDHHGLLINATNSLPNWAFFLETGRSARRGEYVFFKAPESALLKSHFGEHPAPFGKIVYGVAGDLVTRDGTATAVNGRVVSLLKDRTRRGVPLEPGPVGRVPDGCYYVGTPHKDGFDSRYAAIGWVCATAIVGVGVPIL